jgi:hypothetical protein
MPELVWVNFPVSATNVAQFNGATRCDAFYTDDDQDRHVLVATSNELYEVFYSYRGIATAVLQPLDAAPNDVAGIYSPNNKSRHAFVQNHNGYFTEMAYHPVVPTMELISLVGNIPLRLSVLYDNVMHYWHAMLLDQNGGISHACWNQKTNVPNYANWGFEIGNFGPNVVADIGAFFSPDGLTKHTIVAGFDGTLTEAYWNSTDAEQGFGFDSISLAGLGTVPGGVTSVAAFYVPGGPYTRRVVAAGPQGVFEFAYDPAIAGVRAAKLLVPDSEVLDIGGFYSPDDNVCHATILLKGDGVTQIVQEVYYPA